MPTIFTAPLAMASGVTSGASVKSMSMSRTFSSRAISAASTGFSAPPPPLIVKADFQVGKSPENVTGHVFIEAPRIYFELE
ncbi:MAG TPA: hypothetical protein PLV33_09145 [Opitutaceae bacterium]|nr:hypothetical protein [Opitutaceae bacterium]HOR25604.1 hypothetical protein [Opitutaceae bacterium]